MDDKRHSFLSRSKAHMSNLFTINIKTPTLVHAYV